jgi:photosystem II stability/assembly factor-like uncharacterized protein
VVFVYIPKLYHNMYTYAKHLLTFFLLFASTSIFAQNIQPTPAQERWNSMAVKKELEKNSTYNHIPFKNIGPTVMSGRVVDVEVNPTDPTEFYVAYATGGLWHTTNNGQSFTPITDSIAENFGIGDIAVNWDKRIIWLGTGEVNSSRSSYAGVGIYKTNNNGKTWNYVGLGESHHIGKIQLHPTNENIAWVAVLGHLYTPNTERGIYKTTDGGTTWKQTLYKDENTGAIDVDINPSNPLEVYAALWYKTRKANQFVESGSTSGIYKSVDGGDTWTMVSVTGSGFMQGNKIGRIGIAVFPKNANIIYAVVDNNSAKPAKPQPKKDSSYTITNFKNLDTVKFAQLSDKWIDTFLKQNRFPKKYTAKQIKEDVKNGKLQASCIADYLDSDDGFQNTGIVGCEVYKSTDAGKNWKKVNDSAIGIYNTYGYYFGKIFVSPYNENKVFITGFNVQMSTDGGKKFKTIDKENVHPDHHSIWINPKRDSHIINGNDGGLCISYDNGDNWFLANTPPVGQFYGISTDNAKPYNVYGGLQDNGVWFGSSKTKLNNDWYGSGHNPYTSINGGDGMQVQVDTRDNKTVYSGFQFGVYSRQHLDSNGRGAIGVRPTHNLGEKPLRFNWQTPILLSKWNQDIFYIGANKLYRSFNKGENLEPLIPEATNGKVTGNVPYGTITTISESNKQYGILYIGTDDGNVWVTHNSGTTWNKIIDGLPQGLWVSRVVASKHKAGRVYVTLNGYRYDHFVPYIYSSEDYGKTWKNISAGLPNEPVNVLREDEQKDNTVYIGTDGGLYVSTNNGSTYMAWTNGLPKSVPIHDITIQAQENEILLGTHGRSIYVAKLNELEKKKEKK